MIALLITVNFKCSGHRKLLTIACFRFRKKTPSLQTQALSVRERVLFMSETTLENDGWELEGAATRQKENPEKFERPSPDELLNLQFGDMVKLLFLFWEYDKPENKMVSCERMWVTIETLTDTKLSGTLVNEPSTSEVLKPQDQIDFVRDHVCGLLIRATDPRHPASGETPHYLNKR